MYKTRRTKDRYILHWEKRKQYKLGLKSNNLVHKAYYSQQTRFLDRWKWRDKFAIPILTTGGFKQDVRFGLGVESECKPSILNIKLSLLLMSAAQPVKTVG